MSWFSGVPQRLPVSGITQSAVSGLDYHLSFQEAVVFFSQLSTDVQGQLRVYFVSEAQKADAAQAKAILETRKHVEDLLIQCNIAKTSFELLPPYVRKEISACVSARNAWVGADIVRGIEAWLKGERE